MFSSSSSSSAISQRHQSHSSAAAQRPDVHADGALEQQQQRLSLLHRRVVEQVRPDNDGVIAQAEAAALLRHGEPIQREQSGSQRLSVGIASAGDPA